MPASTDYREIPPPPELAAWVESFWTARRPPPHPSDRPYRVLPDGCIDLRLGSGSRSREYAVFENYSDEARRALFYGRNEAHRLGSRAIEPEHFLLGILRESEKAVVQLLRRFGVTPN